MCIMLRQMANESVVKMMTWKDNDPKSLCCTVTAADVTHVTSEPHESNPPYSISLKISFDVVCSTPRSSDWFFFRQELFMQFVSLLSLILRRLAFQFTYRNRSDHFVKLGTV